MSCQFTHVHNKGSSEGPQDYKLCFSKQGTSCKSPLMQLAQGKKVSCGAGKQNNEQLEAVDDIKV